jgi:hypothetical protein
MSTREKITAIDVGEALAGPAAGRSAEEAADLLLAWRRAGIVPDEGKMSTGRRGRPRLLFDQSAPAIALILMWLHDNAGIRDAAHLGQFWRFLAEPNEAGGHPLADHILAEVSAGNSPILILTRWAHVVTGELQTSVAVRFDDELTRPIAGPTPDYEAVAYITLETGALLSKLAAVTVSVDPSEVH